MGANLRVSQISFNQWDNSPNFTPHTPEHNGIAERKHCHIIENSLTLLHKEGIPKSLWHCAFLATVYIINRMVTPNLSQKSPNEYMFNQSPNFTKLRVFGCQCYPWT